MSAIWIKCSATGREVSTGIETYVQSFAKFPDTLKDVVCPACGMRHDWHKTDAWLADGDHGLTVIREAS
jgi:hypothetical protein